MCLPRVIKSFQNYRGVATTLYPTLVYYKIVCFLKQKPIVIQTNTSYFEGDIMIVLTTSFKRVLKFLKTFVHFTRQEEENYFYLFLSFRRVVNVIYSFLGNSPASEI